MCKLLTRIKKLLGYMEKQIYLYKFRPDNDYTIKLLREQRLHFSHPSDYNDPFDCHPQFRDNFTDDYIESLISEDNRFSKEDMPIIKSALNDTKEFQHEVVEKVFNALYVCCFSQNFDSPLMWAHYGGNHEGLCLGLNYNIKGTYLATGVKRPVKYVKNRKPLKLKSLSSNNPGDIIELITEKFKPWSYEEEIRIVKTPAQMVVDGEPQNSFEKSSLEAVYFGLKMPKERQEFYRLLCKQCGLDKVKFYQMTKPDNNSYYLVPKEI